MPSNNPFAPAPPTEVSQAAHRFPDVLNQDPDLRHHQQQPGLYPPQQQGYGLAPQQTGLGYAPSPSPYGTPAPPPQLSPSPQPGYTGYQPQSQSLQPQQTGYTNSAMYTSGGPAYSQPQQPQPYFSDLDPYSSLGASSFAAPSSSATSHQQQQQGGGTLLAVPQTTSHPRDYVHENKAALMVWDEYAWKQLFSRLDALREAWETRIAGLKAASNSGADPTNVLSLRRDAEDKVDGIHASKMQLDEVKTGWRHSTDVASKARVREALNAGLSSLPAYPAPLNPSQLGGSFVHHAQKDAIMAQYSGYYQQQPQQPSGGGFLQPQATGYQQPQMTGYSSSNGMGMGTGMGMQPQMAGYGGGTGGMGMGMQPQMTGYGGGGGTGTMGYGQQQPPLGGGYGGGQQQYY